jgi:hypothetical protein
MLRGRSRWIFATILKEEWWRTYFEGIWDENNTALRLPLGQYFAAAGMP